MKKIYMTPTVDEVRIKMTQMIAASETLGLDSDTEIGGSSEILSTDPEPTTNPFDFCPELAPFKL